MTYSIDQDNTLLRAVTGGRPLLTIAIAGGGVAAYEWTPEGWVDVSGAPDNERPVHPAAICIPVAGGGVAVFEWTSDGWEDVS